MRKSSLEDFALHAALSIALAHLLLSVVFSRLIRAQFHGVKDGDSLAQCIVFPLYHVSHVLEYISPKYSCLFAPVILV